MREKFVRGHYCESGWEGILCWDLGVDMVGLRAGEGPLEGLVCEFGCGGVLVVDVL